MNELMENIMLQLSTQDFSSDQLIILQNTLCVSMSEYDIIHKETLPQIYDDRLSTEIINYICRKKVKGLKESTLQQYSFVLKYFLVFINKPMEDITDADILLFLEHFEKQRNCGKRRKNNVRVILSGFFNYLHNTGKIRINPIATVERIKLPSRERKYLNSIEVIKMRNTCKDIKEKAMFEFFLSTGCRVSEVVNCRIQDINFELSEVKIIGKGDKERTVFLNANAKYTLTEYLNSRVDNNDALFVSSKKPYKPMGKTGIEAVIRKIGERCLDRPVFCHLLRHTCATTLVQHGMPIEQVQYILGHSSLDTTMIYAKTSKEQTKYNFNMSFV